MATPSNNTIELFELVNKRKYKPEDVAKIKSLLENGADANYQDEDDLEKATIARVLNSWDADVRLEVVKLLIQFNADVNMEFDDKTPLTFAAWKNDLKLIELLLKHNAGAGIDYALKTAIEKDNYQIMELFIAQGVNTNCFEPYTESYLNYCNEAYRLRNEDKEYDNTPGIKTANLLIKNGANVNGVEGARNNPLQAAIAHNFVELAELLLKNGAKPITQNDEYPILSQVSSVEMAKLFMDAGAEVNSFNENYPGRTALSNSIESKNKKLITLFIEAGADLYAVDKHNYTAFHHALYSEDLKFLEFLLGYYNLDKCNKIKPLLEVADEKIVIDFIKEKMGLKTKGLGFK